jgi:peptidyl-prolyl cis-trans isomerase B (cyclophilin B)
MANRGPGTASSQFFIVYKKSTLPAGYTIVGSVADGLDVVKYVAAAGVTAGSSDATDGSPAQPLVIKTAEIQK